MAPVVIEARGIHKSFRVPEHRMDSFKERATHPFTRVEYRELQALRDISFEVQEGEFFGIVGRNGSGKSTLLKILASIYRADSGSVRMSGRLAPFIELGVGFDPELTARENAVLNGVLMGLTKREARHRLDAVVDFAELEEFRELKLKNYSSGMLVRLAFAVMVQADADIMLMDEVLAVGDAAFARKCMDVFHERNSAGKTILLVSHDMTMVQSLCDRVLLLEDGELLHDGDAEEGALRYLRLNFARSAGNGDGDLPSTDVDFNVAVIDAGLKDGSGRRIENVEQGQPLVLDALVEARRDLESPRFALQVLSEDGTVVFNLIHELREPVAGGRRVRLSGTIANALVPGSYSLHCWVSREGEQGVPALQGVRLLDFVVFGAAPAVGVVLVDSDVVAAQEPEERG